RLRLVGRQVECGPAPGVAADRGRAGGVRHLVRGPVPPVPEPGHERGPGAGGVMALVSSSANDDPFLKALKQAIGSGAAADAGGKVYMGSTRYTKGGIDKSSGQA